MTPADTSTIADELRRRIPEKELEISATRSSGPGGQNVNKVNTRVLLTFDLAGSRSLSEDEKRRIHRKLRTRISKGGILRIVTCQYRTQAANRKLALQRFYDYLAEALRPTKRRIPTGVPWRSREARLQAKKASSERKRLRQRPPRDNGGQKSGRGCDAGVTGPRIWA